MFKTVKGWKIVDASEEEINTKNAAKVVLDNGETVLVYPPKGCENVQVPAAQLKAFAEACKKHGIEIDADIKKAEQGLDM